MAEVSEQSLSEEQVQAPQAPQAPQQEKSQPAPVILPAGQKHFYGTGRRKTSIARVFLRPGSGEITVNGRPFEQYFPTVALRTFVLQPMEAAEVTSRFATRVTVTGGGPFLGP